MTPYLVLADGDAVGYLQVWWDAEGGGLDMFLEPSARGRGRPVCMDRAGASRVAKGRLRRGHTP